LPDVVANQQLSERRGLFYSTCVIVGVGVGVVRLRCSLLTDSLRVFGNDVGPGFERRRSCFFRQIL